MSFAFADEELFVVSENLILCAKLAYDTAHPLSAALSKVEDFLGYKFAGS